MATKYRTRENRGYIEKVEVNRYEGVTIHLRYPEEGPKHITYVTHKISIDWCNMLSMTERFHEIMDSMRKQVARAQARLRGEG